MKTDTIAAISTALSDSGIGMVRISGDEAIEIGNRIFCNPAGKHILKNVESHTIHYGYVVDFCESEIDCERDTWKKYIIDEVMVSVMKAPRSYTAEDTVEISCHGGVLVMQKILETVCKNGARMAEPGEFTKRAFLNGRIDLSKAEAVIDVIHSKNEFALNSSISQLRGSLSDKIRELREGILYEIAFIESALDDPEHISLEGYPPKLLDKIEKYRAEIKVLIESADNGRLMKEGINTVIVGKPNAGKSSLMNLLVGEERAIVTEIAGTTRDIIQENVRMHGISLNVIDTAGIRSTEDVVEKIGVEKAKKYAAKADLILFVADTSVEMDENDREILSLIGDKKVIVLLNKTDLETVTDEEKIWKLIEQIRLEGIHLKNEKVQSNENYKYDNANKSDMNKNDMENNKKTDFEKFHNNIIMVRTSTKENIGMEEFEQAVKNLFFSGMVKSNDEIVISNLRHKTALQDSFESLGLVMESINNGMAEDFYSIDLMSAYASLGYIIGEEVDDDLVEEIFSKFCMGK